MSPIFLLFYYRYSYVDLDESKKEHRPVMPKYVSRYVHLFSAGIQTVSLMQIFLYALGSDALVSVFLMKCLPDSLWRVIIPPRYAKCCITNGQSATVAAWKNRCCVQGSNFMLEIRHGKQVL